MTIPRKRFYFLRHGETEYNAKGLLAGGNCDISINQKGRDQALLVKPLILKLPIQTICHSPMKRAVETMDIATEKLSAKKIVLDGLRECLPDTWKKMAQLPPYTTSDNDEVLTFFSTVLHSIKEALSHPEPVLIVAHGGIHFAFCHQMRIIDHHRSIPNCQLVCFDPVDATDWKAAIVQEI